MDTIRPAAVTADPSTETTAGRPRKRLKGLAQFAGFAPASVLFGLFFIAPLGLIVVYSFWRTKDYSLVHDWNLGNYRTFLHTRTYLKTFLKTVVMGVLATATTIGLAMPFCYWLVRYVSKRLQRTLLLLVVLPFWTSYLLRVYSWVAILGDNGALNTVLNKVGVTSGAHRYLLYDNPGVYLVLVYLYFPFAVLTLYASLERFDWNLLRAARDLGATPAAALRRVVAPQMRLSIATASIFVFIPILGEYLAPQVVGGTKGVMIGNLIANFFAGFLLPLGSAASVLVALVIVVLLVIFRRSLDTGDVYAA